MISVKEATDIILNNTITLEAESVPLGDAIGRVLLEPLIADRDFPPYDRVTMDGIAIHFDSFEKGQRRFPIEAIGAAGAPQLKLQNSSNCIEIMTGAILPVNTDTVIRYEDLQIEKEQVHIQIDKIRKGQNVHWKGMDQKQGAVVVPAGQVISSTEIGVAATVGKAHLQVRQMPKTIIISTGDELVEINESPLPHQIRKSNVHRIKASLKQWGVKADTAHLLDNPKEIKFKLEKIINDYQVLIISGGVSKGKFDFIPNVLKELGVVKLFHRIAQRPGKPFWFGKAANHSTVFALPGNPVSSFMCTHRYFYPWLRACLGINPMPYPNAVLAKDYFFKPDLTYFLQVHISSGTDGTLQAHPIEGHGSGDLANLVSADGFLELPRGKNDFKKGEVFPFLRFRY